MIVLPAIDIKDGKCVRLKKGDFATVHQVAEDPLAAARSFEAAGARWLHMVDLDGAKDGASKNSALFAQVAAFTGLKVELGGGIRTMQAIEACLSAGISRVILGSAAVKNPDLVRQAVQAYGEAIAVGIDAKNGVVATEGWVASGEIHYLELARRMEDAGVGTIIYTDIGRDGMLQGINRQQLAELAQTVRCRITASGGVRDLEDIRACKEMGLYGVICGKSLYSGTLSLAEAIREAGEGQC